ncbi:MAG: 1,4-dihydroxy-2-naphthoate polyprenyltransferase [Thermomicrobiales bacterium]|nr:1,4-dihydroxy-2-naphthoate polyprenyltransferase [Thermomicrobiales bacterium]
MVNAATAPAGSPLQPWMLAARPKTLPAALSPVIVGCAVGAVEGRFDLAVAVAALTVALLLQIGANFANDVADFRSGADTEHRLGPTRVTQSGLLSARQVAAAAAGTLALAAVPGLYLVWRGGWVFAVGGLLAIAAAVAYTAGPAYGYVGLGDIAVFLFFGPVAVAGTAYLMTSQVTPLALLSSIPMGCLITAILVVNNLRDIDTDRAAGKHTLAVRLGRRGARAEYALLLALSYLAPVAVWLAGLASPWVLLSLASAPLAWLLLQKVRQSEGRALNPVLAGTARLCLFFAVAYAVGVLV